MLGVGVDLAESFHDVALGRPGEGVIEQFRIEHGPADVQRLVGRCLELEPDPAEVRVFWRPGTACWSRRWPMRGSQCCR